MNGMDTEYISTIPLEIRLLNFCIVEIFSVEFLAWTNYNKGSTKTRQ